MSEHELAVVALPGVQVQPVSTAQTEFHPSPLTKSPSSQYPTFVFTTNPSPQISIQVLAVLGFPPEQDHLDSTVQLELHPSPLVVPPSSQ